MKLISFNLAIGTQIFKAFSDEARVRILHLLVANKEMCISDLELVLDFTQTKTSRHIAYLKNAGLLSIRRVDQFAFYRVKKEFSDIVGQLLKYLDKDQLLDKDLEIYAILNSNRELSIHKLNRKHSF